MSKFTLFCSFLEDGGISCLIQLNHWKIMDGVIYFTIHSILRGYKWHLYYTKGLFNNLFTHWAELGNWLPVCKSKCRLWNFLARLNSVRIKSVVFSGVYNSKPELMKPNILNQLYPHDKMSVDQFKSWKIAHFKRRSNLSVFFCKIKFHPWW